MQTLILWRALHNARMTHPLFRHVFQRNTIRPGTAHYRVQRVFVGFFPLVGALFLCSMLSMLPAQRLALVILFPLVMGFIAAARYALGLSSRIVEERESGRYDLILTAPGGGLLLHWALALDWVDRQPRARMIVVGLLLVSLALLLITPGQQGLWTYWYWFVLFDALVYADAVQSQTLALLAAMVAVRGAQTRLRAQARGGALFAVMQLTLYLSVLGIAAVNTAGFALMPPPERLTFLVPVVAGAFAVREALIFALWRIFLYQQDPDAVSVAAVLTGSV